VNILPCPWCGSSETRWEGEASWGFLLTCDSCYASGPARDSKEQAIRAWNEGPSFNISERLKAHADQCEAEAKELEEKAKRIRARAAEASEGDGNA